jgi:hypothetical protein
VDVAQRCAYYGNAKLKPEEIAKYIDRKPAIFTYAAICNSSILLNPKLRRLVGEGGGGAEFKWRYLRIVNESIDMGRSLNGALIPAIGGVDDEAEDDTDQEGRQARILAKIDQRIAALGEKVAPPC